uniref:Secreted C13 protease-like protein n=1 Tax=Pristhesancus plagipennis TaxID=1955184 RepID=A0A2K8JWR3_PRIPG|nr:secreted C13 protease-like protein [Pristhesancus plagipennis]
MKLLILAPLLVCGVLSASVPTDPLSDEFIHYINSLETTWKAGRNFDKDLPREFLKTLNGVIEGANASELPKKNVSLSVTLPVFFDARTNWPYCPSISEIRDQGSCASCWAMAAVEAMSDRICIHSGGQLNVHLSADNVLACCINCNLGCNGGYPGKAWTYWQSNGIVSGGNYGTEEGCQPYSFPPCEHYIPGLRPQCSGVGYIPACQYICHSGAPYVNDLHYGLNSYSIVNNPVAVQNEIYINGPVEAIITVYEDIINYKQGVYQHVAGGTLGTHAVKILGWGIENNTPYWLVANSWSNDWGDNGFFKILRGVNHCGIEDNILAGLPRK